MASFARKLLLALGIFIAAAIAAGVGLKLYYNDAVPTGAAGKEADDLARRIETAVRLESFRSLQAVQFTFRGKRHHYRDLKRKLAEVKIDDMRILINLKTGKFAAYKNHERLQGAAAAEAFRLALKIHTNDFFWLNPFDALFAPGTQRYKISDRELLVSYLSGGITPGDSYLFETDNAGLPMQFRMWVQILPLQGLKFSFEDWMELDGALFARSHKAWFGDTAVSNIKTFGEAQEKDIFKEIL